MWSWVSGRGSRGPSGGGGGDGPGAGDGDARGIYGPTADDNIDPALEVGFRDGRDVAGFVSVGVDELGSDSYDDEGRWDALSLSLSLSLSPPSLSLRVCVRVFSYAIFSACTRPACT